MAIQHGDISNPQHVHECKQILGATFADAGKVITPSGDGTAELRRLKYSEIDGTPDEDSGSKTRTVIANSSAQVVVSEDYSKTIVVVTYYGASVFIGGEVEPGTEVVVVKAASDASVEVVLDIGLSWVADSKESIEDVDDIHSSISIVVLDGGEVLGY